MAQGHANRSAVRFFMYVEPALDHGSWFKKCDAFHAIRASSNNDNLAEVGLRHSLLQSPLRVPSPELAQIFYVPVFEFAVLGFPLLHRHRIGRA